jgi:peptide deformylase
MPIKQILTMGDPHMNPVAEPISDFDSQQLHQLIEDMRDTMADANGAALATPQIGVIKRVVIFSMQGNIRYPDATAVPETVLINPIDRTVDGFHAVVVQHECDHLDGILYPSRITDLTRFGFEAELAARDDYP